MGQPQGQAPKLALTPFGRRLPDGSPPREARLNNMKLQKKGKIKDNTRETIIQTLGVVTTYLAGMWQRYPCPWDHRPGAAERWRR